MQVFQARDRGNSCLSYLRQLLVFTSVTKYNRKWLIQCECVINDVVVCMCIRYQIVILSSIHPFVHLSIYLFIQWSIHFFNYLTTKYIHPMVHPFFQLSIHLSNHPLLSGIVLTNQYSTKFLLQSFFKYLSEFTQYHTRTRTGTYKTPYFSSCHFKRVVSTTEKHSPRLLSSNWHTKYSLYSVSSVVSGNQYSKWQMFWYSNISKNI